jgi:hypothetical protein
MATTADIRNLANDAAKYISGASAQVDANPPTASALTASAANMWIPVQDAKQIAAAAAGGLDANADGTPTTSGQTGVIAAAAADIQTQVAAINTYFSSVADAISFGNGSVNFNSMPDRTAFHAAIQKALGDVSTIMSTADQVDKNIAAAVAASEKTGGNAPAPTTTTSTTITTTTTPSPTTGPLSPAISRPMPVKAGTPTPAPPPAISPSPTAVAAFVGIGAVLVGVGVMHVMRTEAPRKRARR